MANTRVYYATQAVGLKPANPANASFGTQVFPKGLQSVGITTNFNLEQVFQLGQLEIYDNVENVPDVEVSLQKIADGTKFLYPICVQGTGTAFDVELGKVSTNRVEVELRTYKDTSSDAFDAQNATAGYGEVTCSGMYLSSVAYTIPVEGFITEDVTLVGNSKIYENATGAGAGNDDNSGDLGNQLEPHKIGRRINLSTLSVLPTGTVAGNKAAAVAGTDGTLGSIALNPRDAVAGDAGRETRPYLQNINISMDLGREAVFELGKFSPYARYATFPVEISSEFEVLAESHDQIQAKDFDRVNACSTDIIKNVDDRPIKIVICGKNPTADLYSIDLGKKNKLTSVNYGGGDAGGGNATITYSYQTFNKFKVDASGTFISTNAAVVVANPV